MKQYLVSFKVSFIDSLTYKFNFVLTILFAFFPIIIQLFIWNNVFSGAASGVMFGYTFSQMIYYAVLCNFINTVATTNAHYKIGGEIKNGELNTFIVKPVNYIGFRLADSFGGKALETGILGLLLAAILTVVPLAFGLELPGFSIPVFALFLLLAILLNFFLFLSISLLTFWITDAGSMFGTISIVITVLSGGVFPIDIFGETFVNISRVLPFQYMVYTPLNYALGKLTGSGAAISLGIQALWAGLLCLVCIALWNRGVKRYTAVGG
jgi:ABC-2 type transport system permease protein